MTPVHETSFVWWDKVQFKLSVYGIKLQDLPIEDNSYRHMNELYSGWSEAMSF